MRTSKLLRTVQYLFAVCVAFGVLAPIGWLFISSISYQSDLTSVPLKWIPKHITFQRYIDIFVNPNNNAAHTFKIAMLNSIEISISVMIVALFIGGLAAYAFARLKFRFQRITYLFVFIHLYDSACGHCHSALSLSKQSAYAESQVDSYIGRFDTRNPIRYLGHAKLFCFLFKKL